MQILFVDAPNGVSSINSAKKFKSHWRVKKDIGEAWKAWASANSFPAMQSLTMSKASLAKALLEDNYNKLVNPVPQHLIECFVQCNPPTLPNLKARPFVLEANKRFKSIASEVVGAATAIAMARSKGLDFVGARDDLNAFFGVDVWDKPWKGNGPDYLFASTAGEFTFVEAKGQLSDKHLPFSVDAEFKTHKLQSINARLVAPPLLAPFFGPISGVRYVLSRVRLDANQNLVLQWFNHRDPGAEEGAPICAPMVLGIAYSNFWTILRSMGGNTDDASFYVGRQDKSWVEIRSVNRRSGELSDSAAFVPSKVLELMRRMHGWSADYRRAKAVRRVSDELVHPRWPPKLPHLWPLKLLHLAGVN